VSDPVRYSAPLISEMVAHERPRERLERHGADQLMDRELIAILLRTGRQGMSVLSLAESLLREFGSLEALAKADLKQLRSVKGVGRAKAIELKAAFALAQRLSDSKQDKRQEISTPEAAASMMRNKLLLAKREEFHILMLDRKNRFLGSRDVTKGTVDATVVDAREVFEPAIVQRASSVILVHNHPSGDPTPSREDIALTKELVKAGQILKIEVLDHVIMGRKTEGRANDYVSLKELGLL